MMASVIPSTTVIFIVITLLITVIGPFVGVIVLSKKYNGILPAILVGITGFYLPQIVIRIPGLQLLSTIPEFVEFANSNAELYFLFLAFTAALFETAGRVGVFYLMRKKLSYKFGLGAGYGHGAIEALYLIGFSYISNLVVVFMYNTGGLTALAGLLGAESAAQSVVATFAETDPALFLLAGFERAFVVVFHIAMSLIICLGYMKGKLWHSIGIVMVSHTLFDFAGVMLNNLGISVYLVELFILACAVASAVVIVKIKDKFDVDEVPPDEASVALREGY